MATAPKTKARASPGTPEINDKPITKNEAAKETVAEHLPPLGLIFTVIACSGFLFVYSFRDVFATGKVFGGSMDMAMQSFTKSIEFFDDTRGWKSQQGGLSAIQQVTTDANNMGGFFVRKLAGAAGLAVQLQKLLPLLFHPLDARWKMGHFRPLLWTAIVANIILAAFYTSYLGDFAAAGADGLPRIFIGVQAAESVVILFYLFSSRKIKKGPAVAMPDGKTPESVTSRIVARTVGIVSGAISLIAGRDFFFPGQIIDFIPRDDIYLEWTGAFLHSPPEGTPEAEEHGLMTGLYIGDKFLAQLLGLNFLLLCLYKFVSSVLVKYGSDGSGQVKARMIWKAQALGNALILFLFRLFAPAAASASLDLRWHLMSLAYETFVLGLFGFC